MGLAALASIVVDPAIEASPVYSIDSVVRAKPAAYPVSDPYSIS